MARTFSSASTAANAPAALDALEAGFPFLVETLVTFGTGDLYAREVLDDRTRELVLTAAVAALGLVDSVKAHGEFALNAGATEEELKEICYLTTISAGFPRAVQTARAVAELLASRQGG